MIVGTSAVYRPTCTGSPAIVEYAMAIGITTAALVSPASTSGHSHSFRYPISQSSMPKAPLLPMLTVPSRWNAQRPRSTIE